MSSLTAQAKKKIVVFPATGWQGRWVCECLSKDPQYEVVGIARNPDGPKANMAGVNLRDLGIQLVKGDFADPEGYRQYLRGAHGVFINTDFFSIFLESEFDTAKAIATEIKYGEAIIAECAKAQVQHIVYSGLTESCEYTADMFPIGCLTIQEQLKASNLPWTLIYAGSYWENLHLMNFVKPASDGSDKIAFGLAWPGAIKQQFCSIKSTGAFVKAILDDKERFLRKEVYNTTEEVTYHSFAERIAALSGKDVVITDVSDEAFKSDEMKQALGPAYPVVNSVYHTYRKVYFPGTTGREVVPDLPTFEEWAQQDPYMREVLGL